MNDHGEPVAAHFDAVVVGAGFAGLYMLHRLRLLGFSVRVYEAGSGVGGTWYWNRYPGARCDVESVDYSYSFSEVIEQEWTWSERYATQPEILSYLDFVADRLELRSDICFDTRVASATFDESSGEWEVVTEDGERAIASFCIMATGCLSEAKLPEIEGVEDFARPTYHTGRWPHRRSTSRTNAWGSSGQDPRPYSRFRTLRGRPASWSSSSGPPTSRSRRGTVRSSPTTSPR